MVAKSKFTDSRFVSLKIKDAIVDQFREKFGIRPNVSKEDPDLIIFVKVFKNQVSVSVDTSGESLTKRGYRLNATKAPLREHLAAALLMLSKWDKKTTLVDPMCGSGNFFN